MLIHFKDIGSSLGTRQLGAEIRNQIENRFDFSDRIIMDFSGVDVISNSFADECFGKLFLTHNLDFIRNHISFKNTTPFVKAVISKSLNQRMESQNHR